MDSKTIILLLNENNYKPIHNQLAILNRDQQTQLGRGMEVELWANRFYKVWFNANYKE